MSPIDSPEGSSSPPPVPSLQQPEMGVNAFEMRETPRSVPAAPLPNNGSTSGAASGRGSMGARLKGWLKEKYWFSNSMAFTTLLVSAVGLLFFGWRTYRLQVLATFHSYVQNCYSQIQVSFCYVVIASCVSVRNGIADERCV